VLIDLLGVVHRQYELVGVPVAEQITPGGDDECDQGATATADQVSDRLNRPVKPASKMAVRM
jgi:hypothetical protein